MFFLNFLKARFFSTKWVQFVEDFLRFGILFEFCTDFFFISTCHTYFRKKLCLFDQSKCRVNFFLKTIWPITSQPFHFHLNFAQQTPPTGTYSAANNKATFEHWKSKSTNHRLCQLKLLSSKPRLLYKGSNVLQFKYNFLTEKNL